MIIDQHPTKILTVGLVFVLLGVLIPFLMVLHIIPASFLLCFLAFGLSFVGVILGIIGADMKAFDWIRQH